MKQIMIMEDFLMSTNIFIFSILYLLTLISIVYIVSFEFIPYLNRKNEILEKDVKNKKYQLFKDIDVEVVKTYIDSYFELYINRYITYKFLSKKIMYINSEEVETMISDTTKLIYIQITELYIFYINMIQSIKNDEDLFSFIHNKVEKITVEIVTNYNRSLTV